MVVVVVRHGTCALLLLLLLRQCVAAAVDRMHFGPDGGSLRDPKFRIEFHPADKPYVPTEAALEVVTMTDRDGARFECHLPPGKKQEQHSVKANDSSITLAADDAEKSPEELMEILRGLCFHRNEGWWTYEFCYPPNGKLRQVHFENKKEVQEFVLGYYDAEATARLHEASPVLVQKDPRSQTAAQKYYAFMYTNGTKCDITDEPRQTEVRFVCPDSGPALIASIKEAPSCKYTLIFQAPMLCRHRLFREEQQPWVVINCNALASGNEEADAETKENNVNALSGPLVQLVTPAAEDEAQVVEDA